MDSRLRVLTVDAANSFYRLDYYRAGQPFFGPVDLGLHLAGRFNALCIGGGLLAGSILPGSNRLIITGFSPCWGGFYVSTMGGAALVFDNLGVNLLSLIGRAASPSVLYLNRNGVEHVEVEVLPVDPQRIWDEAPGGVYAMMEHVLNCFGDRYGSDPRVLAVGPAAAATDFGAIGSAPVSKGRLTHVDTWAGRGGFGSKMLQQHNLVAVIFGGTFVDEDFRDRKVADEWFADKYNKRLKTVDFEATTKYRFDPRFETGGTFGVNYATVGGRLLYFNYRSIYDSEQQRQAVHDRLIVNHYLKQFNQETIETKQQFHCGEPCAAVCKKLRDEYKKDYEPYQTMGPLSGVFDQRAAERLNRKSDVYGFDAISSGGVIAWLMDCLDTGLLKPEELGVRERPMFQAEGFDPVADSAHNGAIGEQLLDSMIRRRGLLDLRDGARRLARLLARDRGSDIRNSFVFTSFARRGWMVPNQYWTPGILAPMAVMGKYYQYYGNDFLPPRELGRISIALMRNELMLDNTGFCRFHRGWAEEMLPPIFESLYGLGQRLVDQTAMTVNRIHSRNASLFWSSQRCIDFVHTFLKRKRDVEGVRRPELDQWIGEFDRNQDDAAWAFWYEMHRGTQESLREI
jgi:glyceraldehyde-3-phosphate dehydrogenase (ferredoxin)